MPTAEPQPVDLPFPTGGVDLSQPADRQPEGTTRDLRNVRAFHLGDRQGGGKRAGFDLAFADPIGDATLAQGRRVNHLSGFNQAGGIPSLDTAPLQPTLLQFADLPNDAYPGAASDQFVSVRYASGGRARFSEDLGSSSIPGQRTLAIGRASARATYAISRWAGDNNLVAVAACNSLDSAVSGGVQGSPRGQAIFTHMNATMDQGIACALTRGAGANQLVVEILDIDGTGNTPPVVVSSADDLVIANSSTYTLDLEFSAVTTGNTVSFTVRWPSQAGSDSRWATGITLTADTAQDFTADYSANRRLGIGATEATGGSGGVPLKFWVSADFKRAVPTPGPIEARFNPVLEPPAGTQRYSVPAGLTSVELQESASNPIVAVVNGPVSLNSRTGALARVPVLDSVDDTVQFEESGELRAVVQTENPSSPPAIQVLPQVISGVFSMSYATRIASDGLSGVAALSPGSSGATNAPQALKRTQGSSAYDCDYFVNGELTLSESIQIGAGDGSSIIIHEDDIVVWRDTGTNIVCQVNGLTVLNHTMNSTQLAAVMAANGGSNRAGGGYERDPSWGFNILAADDAADAVDFSDTTPEVIAFTRSRVFAAGLNDDTMQELIGTGPDNPLVSSGSFANRVYAVDGDLSVIIDPAGGTVTDWASSVTAGAAFFPAGCRLCAIFRGSVFLARQQSNPSAWYKSRTLNPLDWDFNAEPLATTAISGVTGAAGQPGDAITALIPYLDDYLIFGCASSLWMLEGDPAFGGTIVNLSNRTGVVNDRAFTFDEFGRLYFVGNAGLYRIDSMPGRPVPIKPRALAPFLERIDLSTTLVQVTYDEYASAVKVFLTPTDGTTVGVHAVWSVRDEAFYLDEYPVEYGPTAVLAIKGATDDDRRFLIGGTDGLIRRPRDTAKSDTGTPIAAYYDSAPLQPFGPLVESKALELQAALSDGSGAVDWEWFTAASATEVAAKTTGPEETGRWGVTKTGFQDPVGLSAREVAHKLRVSQTSAVDDFRIEHVVAQVRAESRRRLQ